MALKHYLRRAIIYNKRPYEIIDTSDGSLVGGPYQWSSVAEQLAAELNEHYGEPDRFCVLKRPKLPSIAAVMVDNDNGAAYPQSIRLQN